MTTINDCLQMALEIADPIEKNHLIQMALNELEELSNYASVIFFNSVDDSDVESFANTVRRSCMSGDID